MTPDENRDLLWKYLVDKEYDKAIETAIDILTDSRAFDAIHVAGLALAKISRPTAMTWCASALTLAKVPDQWFVNSIAAAKSVEQVAMALEFANRGLAVYPDHAELTYHRGLCLCELRQWDDAIKTLRRSIELDPGIKASTGLGYCYHMLGRYFEAMEVYRNSLRRLSGTDKEAVINNMMCTLIECGRPREALALCDEHYPKPTWDRTVYNRSYILLGLGMWPEGWEQYQTRTKVEGLRIQTVPDDLRPKTLDDIYGQPVTIVHEQGLGDSLMFLRYVRKLEPLVGKITIAVPRPLVRLTRNLILDHEPRVAEIGEGNDLHVDGRYLIPPLDLPWLFRQTVDDIPSEPYFHPVPDSVIEKRSIARHMKPELTKIGLCWAGDSRQHDVRAHHIDKRRSIPFEMMEPLLSLEANLVSLQMPSHWANDARIIHQPIQDDWDLLDTAALIAQLDLVISVDTSVAHLSAALGKPTWLLSRFDGCWRWFYDGRTTSPWYPSMRIWRQKEHHSWPEVLERVRAYLVTVPPSAIGANHILEMQRLARSVPDGCFVEVGVYKGGSAWHLMEVAKEQGRQLHLFDTFTGIPHKGPEDKHDVGDFGDVSLETVKAAVPEADYHVGIFPETLPAGLQDIAFVHCDVDQCESVSSVIDHLFPRMVDGGIMVFDDVDQDGARRVIQETFNKRIQHSNGRFFVRK